MTTPFGELFTSLLARAGISQSEFARQTGSHIAQINKAALGRRNLPNEKIPVAIDLLGLSREEAIRFSLLATGLSDESTKTILSRPERSVKSQIRPTLPLRNRTSE